MSAAALKIKTNSLPDSRMAVELEVPAERCKASYEEALSRLSRSVKLPGFRQGKVPRAVILQQVGVARIKATALESLLETVWREATTQKEIEPLCEPELNGGFEKLFESFNPNEILNVILETDIAPTPKLKTTKGLEAKSVLVSFDPAKVEELIQQSQKQLATIVPIENRPAIKGDIAVVSFKGTYEDGQEIEGGSAESMEIELEPGQMIPGFIEGILGMQINDEKTLKCQFPKDYPQEDARDKKAKFAVTLKDLKTRELPKLDDAFAKQASDKSNMEELRQDLEKRLKEDTERQNKNNRKEALILALVEQLEIDLPKTLIDLELRNLVEQTARKFAQQGMDVKSMFTPELVKSLMESSKDEAKANLQRKFALQALAEQEQLEVEETTINNRIKELTKELSGEKNIDPQRIREVVSEELLEEKIIQWLEENNNVIETSSEKKVTSSTATSKAQSEKSGKKKATQSKSKSEKASTEKPKVEG